MDKRIKLRIIPFLLSFMIGFIFIYINSPKPRVIIKYPTPYNSEKVYYKGLTGDCYKFKYEIVDCDKNAIEQPII